MNDRPLNLLIFKYSTDLNLEWKMEDEEINNAQQDVSNLQLEEGELQPVHRRAPKKGQRKEMVIPGRKKPTEQMTAYQSGQLIPLGRTKKRPPTKFETNSPSKHHQRAMSFEKEVINRPAKPLQQSASFSFTKNPGKQTMRRAISFGGEGNFNQSKI
uniref:Uncharacterized protein n=1 Tax=Meloidogyne enterolobii TaxID=390850 RepID=A0A6V7XR51_MELEN|nr:unnamed protein product [Meloidogyne enterolobii]